MDTEEFILPWALNGDGDRDLDEIDVVEIGSCPQRVQVEWIGAVGVIELDRVSEISERSVLRRTGRDSATRHPG